MSDVIDEPMSMVGIRQVTEISQIVSGNILDGEEDAGHAHIILFSELVMKIITAPHPTAAKLLQTITDGTSSLTPESLYKGLDDAARTAWQISKNILGKDADFESLLSLAKAAIAIAFAPHAPVKTVDAFLNQNAQHPEKARVYTTIDHALRKALDMARADLSEHSVLLTPYAASIIDIAFATHASKETRDAFLNP